MGRKISISQLSAAVMEQLERVRRIGHGGYEGSGEKGRYGCPEGY